MVSSICKVRSSEVGTGIQCEGHCGRWFHPSCGDLSNERFQELSDGDEKWFCAVCVTDNGVSNENERGVSGKKDSNEAKKEVVKRVSDQFKVKSVFAEKGLLVAVQHCYKDMRDEYGGCGGCGCKYRGYE